MKKTAFIWRESIYKTAENDIFRCNKCKCQLANIKTADINVNVATQGPHKDFMFCPDCNNCVGRITEVEDDKEGYMRGLYKDE